MPIVRAAHPACRTQRPTGRGYVSLELALGADAVPDLLVWIEVKHRAEVVESQLEKYASDIERGADEYATAEIWHRATQCRDRVARSTLRLATGREPLSSIPAPGDTADTIAAFLVDEFS